MAVIFLRNRRNSLYFSKIDNVLASVKMQENLFQVLNISWQQFRDVISRNTVVYFSATLVPYLFMHARYTREAFSSVAKPAPRKLVANFLHGVHVSFAAGDFSTNTGLRVETANKLYCLRF